MKDKNITISINWNNLESIKQAERTKARLENKGYTLINNFGGLTHSAMIYAPPSI
jgi:hypothetical protein